LVAIPPSIKLVVMGLILEVPVTDLFAAAIIQSRRLMLLVKRQKTTQKRHPIQKII